MIRKSLCMIALAALLPAPELVAQDLPTSILPDDRKPLTRQGTRGANFLQLGVGARGAAMSGAIASLTEGPTAFYWNPAGAASMESFSVAASRQNLYEGLDITHNFIGVGLPVGAGVVGLNFISLNSGDMARTDPGSPLGNGTVFGETFSWTAASVGLGYARRLTDRLDIGVGAKYVTEGISDANQAWFGVDLGTQFRTGLYGLTIGASMQNVGPSSQMRGALLERVINDDDISNQIIRGSVQVRESELPTMFRFSVGSDLLGGTESLFGAMGGRQRLRGEMAFSDAIDTDIQLAFGAEYAFNNMLFVRAGKRFYNDDRAIGGTRGMYGLSGGFGLRLPVGARSVRFDYSYTGQGELENYQVFSFEFGR